MDEPANLMQINGVLVLDVPVPVARVKAIVRRRLLPIPRFRQRVVLDGARPRWEEDAAFDLDRHVVETTLPAPGGDAALASFIGEMMSTPLPSDRPLWAFHLLQGYRGGCALLGRIHHSIGDGVALMLVVLSLTDLLPDGEPTVVPRPDQVVEEPAAAEAMDGGGGNPFTDLFCHPRRDLARIRALAEEISPELMRLLNKPVEALRGARLLAGIGSVGSLGRLVGRPSDPPSAFKGPLGVPKVVAWSAQLPVDRVKEIGRALGGSINDVLVSATAGGMRRYLARRAVVPPRLDVRAVMPVNLRPLGLMAQLGNHFGLIFLALPLGIADPLERLAAVRRRSHALRRSTEPTVVYAILRALGRVPLAVQRLAVKIFGTKATLVLTNVPGPRQTLYLAGKPIRDIFFWVPQSGHVGLGVSILSYRGSVRLGVATDAGLVPDPDAIVAGFDEELRELASRAGVSLDGAAEASAGAA
jgi:diacylglycerol O-acyltransferase